MRLARVLFFESPDCKPGFKQSNHLIHHGKQDVVNQITINCNVYMAEIVHEFLPAATSHHMPKYPWPNETFEPDSVPLVDAQSKPNVCITRARPMWQPIR